MPPEPLQLRRRRWTLVFSIPFLLFIVLGGVYCVVALSSGFDGRLGIALAVCAGFTTFCVAGTLGKLVFEAIVDKGPALIVNARGLHDLRSKRGLIPWGHIERVRFDDEDTHLLVTLKPEAAPRRGRLMRAVRSLLSVADYSIALGALSYDHGQLKRTLDAFHRAEGKSRPKEST